MKNKDLKQAEKSLIEQLRDIRDKVSMDIKGLTLEQLKEYFDKQRTLHPTSFWQHVR